MAGDDQKEQITQIKSARGRVKAALTRLENATDLNSKNSVLIRLQKLDELYKEFDKLDSELNAEDSEIEEFENRYFSLKEIYQNKIDALTVLKSNNTENQSSLTVEQSGQSNANFRLPKLNIPIFSGKFQDWINFKDLFTSLVHTQTTLTNIQKFQYLKGLLSDEPASLIKHIQLSNESYNEAWEKLNERYDKKKQIIHSLIKTFLDQRSISQANMTNLRNLVDTSDEVLRGLKALGTEATSRDPWLIHLLLQKLDPETRRLWSIKTAEKEIPTWKEFLEFLNVRCSSLELMVYDEANVKSQTKSNFVARENIQGKKSDKACLKCSGVHKLFRCAKFKSMDLNARKNFVKSNYLCYLCLNLHKCKDCPNTHLRCSVCQGRHNSLLHEDIKGNKVSLSNYNFDSDQKVNNAEEGKICQRERMFSPEVVSLQQQINSSTSVNNSKCVSFLPTAKVLLYNNEGKSFSFRALLDSGSECSFVSENVINILGLKRKNDRLCLSGIAGVSAGKTRGSVNLKIGSRFSEEFILVKTFILSKVTSQIPMEKLNTKDLHHLKNIPLSDDEYSRPSECDLILGSDCFFTILRSGMIVGSKGQPIAQNTVFGWVVAGQIQSDSRNPIAQSHLTCVDSENNIDSVLQRFWQIEELPVKNSFLSEDEEFCENHFKTTYKVNELWLLKLDWDSPLPDHLASRWLKFQKEIQEVCHITIPRWIQTSSKEIYLHGFCDASEFAYACVIYAVQQQSDGSKVILLAAKSRVAPLKPISIPRLELNGALILARLYSSVSRALEDYSIQFYAWTDSQVVLSWLSSPPRQWKPFVANRTSEILDLTPLSSWRYVPTKENPADIASRGLSPRDLPDCVLWWEGPHWLASTESEWPMQPKLKDDYEHVLKEKKNTKFVFTVFLKNDILDTLIDKYSSYTKLIYVLAFCFRFIEYCRDENLRLNKPVKGKPAPLTISERTLAGNLIICYVQMLYFKEEINCIKENKSLPNKSPLSALCPFLDKDGLLRVGGRLQNSPLQYNAKHPVILPIQHKLSKLIVQYYHKLYLHAGGNLLMGILRQTYWIIGVKRIINSCVHKCISCCRYRCSISKQRMGNLPKERVTPNRPFLVSGVDYTGPISVLKHRGRGAKSTKGYIVLFICFATKAVHLELASDLTSETFIAALRRFCSRRGTPKRIHSDNGSNFLGAKKQLEELFRLISTAHENEKISFFLSQRNIEWHTIPPLSPHFGGLWEAGVKSVKFHVKRVIGNNNLTFEELTTLLTQIEAILNSRPLLKLDNNNDVDNLNILTPFHFLIGEVITSPPEVLEDNKISLRSRWDIVQKMKLNFWKRWHLDYLSSLQGRNKWKSSKDNFNIGEVVIIKEDNVPPSVWPLGKIVATHPGKDGVVRVVTVKTVKGYFKRPIVKLSMLPVHQE